MTSRGRPRAMTKESVDQARVWYREGYTLQAVALKFGVHISTLRRYFIDAGVQFRPTMAELLPSLSRRDASIYAAYTKGVPLARIAKKHGISRQRVHQIAQKFPRREAID